jgi:hypothetical protein
MTLRRYAHLLSDAQQMAAQRIDSYGFEPFGRLFSKQHTLALALGRYQNELPSARKAFR